MPTLRRSYFVIIVTDVKVCVNSIKYFIRNIFLTTHAKSVYIIKIYMYALTPLSLLNPKTQFYILVIFQIKLMQ